jgi:hypothetical protein
MAPKSTNGACGKVIGDNFQTLTEISYQSRSIFSTSSLFSWQHPLGGVPRLSLWLEIVPRNSPSPQFTSIRGTKGLSKSEKKFWCLFTAQVLKSRVIFLLLSGCVSYPLHPTIYPLLSAKSFLLSEHGSTVTELSIQDNITISTFVMD